ncbi:GtrA family protein [Thomasclavelia cocleata]|uniref:GtrA family protein n=1 Tax=Thomasclavelia cocleata TaxID=69824 RepID=UPI002430CBC5|nr:GtrA family protein [Thomasclavelia cocleata]
MKKIINQILKFGLVGGIAFIIDYVFLYLFTEYFNIYYFISAILSFSISVIFNYIASIIWVFDVDGEKSKIKNFIVFIALSVAGLGINQVIMWYGVEVISLYYMYVKLIATIIVMIFNFITRKIFLE